MAIRERIEESDVDRRLVLLLLVVLLVLLGSGVGTFIFTGSSPPPGDNETTPTPTAGPPTETPSETPDGEHPATVTHTPTATDDRQTAGPSTPGTPPDDGGTDGDGSAPTPSPGLELGDDEPLLTAANLAPGDTGEGRLTVRNGEDEDGTLTISEIVITDDENGLVGPEKDVDTADDGELSSHLEVRLSIEDAAGNEEYLFGTDSGYETLGNLSNRGPSTEYPLESGETVTIVADWKLPTDTGNEVQSDKVSVDLGLTLKSVNS